MGIKISAAVRQGKPHEEICEAAKVLAVDLIVLTTHGYTGLKHVWLGSTAEHVVRHAHYPVLVVRAARSLVHDRSRRRTSERLISFQDA